MYFCFYVFIIVLQLRRHWKLKSLARLVYLGNLGNLGTRNASNGPCTSRCDSTQNRSFWFSLKVSLSLAFYRFDHLLYPYWSLNPEQEHRWACVVWLEWLDICIHQQWITFDWHEFSSIWYWEKHGTVTICNCSTVAVTTIFTFGL